MKTDKFEITINRLQIEAMRKSGEIIKFNGKKTAELLNMKVDSFRSKKYRCTIPINEIIETSIRNDYNLNYIFKGK